MRTFLTLLVITGILSLVGFVIYTVKEVNTLKVKNEQLISKVRKLNKELKVLDNYIKAKTNIIYKHQKRKRVIYETPSNYVKFNSIFK